MELLMIWNKENNFYIPKPHIPLFLVTGSKEEIQKDLSKRKKGGETKIYAISNNKKRYY